MPRKLQIADVFKTADLIEKYGSGIKRVLKLFKEHGASEPLFEEKLGGFVVTAYRKDPFYNNLKVNEPLNELLRILKENPRITKEQLSSKLNLSRATITRYIKLLKSKKLLKRVGSDKSGYWEVRVDG